MIAGTWLRMRRLGALTIGLTTLAASALAEQRSEDERRALPVVTYNGGAVTVGEVEDTIANSSPLIQATALEPENLRAFVDRNLRFELQLQEAERRGYRDKPEVQKSARENAVQLMLSRDIDHPIRNAEVSSAELQAHFERHLDAFSVPEKRRASAIFVANEAAAKQLVAQVAAADDAELEKLVQARGLDVPSKARGGALGSFDKKGEIEGGGKLDPKLVSAAFALPSVGAVSDVIKLDDGTFALLKLTELRPGSPVNFHAMQVRVRRHYDEQRYQEQVKAIAQAQREILKPVVRYELLELVEIK